MRILVFNWRCWLNPLMGGAEIFTGTQPNVTRESKVSFEMLFNLNAQSKADFNFYVTVFEYPILGSTLATQSSLYGLFINNTKSYAEKVAEYPLEIFDYRQAIANMNVSYIAIRDDSQITRFAKDPLFSLVFINKEVAIFQIHTFDPLDLDGYK